MDEMLNNVDPCDLSLEAMIAGASPREQEIATMLGAASRFVSDLRARLCQLREARGLSQAELAEAMGTAEWVVRLIESDQEDLGLEILYRYLAALGLEPEVTLRSTSMGDRRDLLAPVSL